MKRRRVALKSTLVITPGYGDKDSLVGVYSHNKRSWQLIQEREAALKKRQEQILKLPHESRNVVNDMLIDNGATPDNTTFSSSLPNPFGAASSETIGENGFDFPEISHAGGEFDELTALLSGKACSKKKQLRCDVRTQMARNRRLHQSWMSQISTLTDAFLAYKHRSTVPLQDTPSQDDPQYRSFEAMSIDVFSRSKATFMQAPGEPANASLLRSGYLGCSPTSPTVAISIAALDLYHRLRRRNPQISIQCITKTLCDLHGVNYAPVLRRQVSDAFDTYLAILREVRMRVDRAMGNDTPNWRIQNSCPCCNYKLENEHPLLPARLLAIDGNNSAKRLLGAGTEDPRLFSSDYFLSRQEVDRFKDEVKDSEGASREFSGDGLDAPRIPADSSGEQYERVDLDGNVDGSTIKQTSCTEHWKASVAEHEKRALSVYDATGIFLAGCRHGFILKVCEMVRSGELAKYPLGIVDHLLDTLGEDQAIGYDIGCSFSKTMRNSAMVGPKAQLMRVTVNPNAFHGWQHNRLCQVTNHPLYRTGFGIEDLEVVERIFSSTNGVARCTRNGTPFHWMQYFDLHFRQWDEDKYEELGNFLYNNYLQSLNILEEYGPEVNKMKQVLNVTDEEIDSWLQDEATFLRDLKDGPPERAVQGAYVEALHKTWELLEQWNETQTIGFLAVPSSHASDYNSQALQTQRRESIRQMRMEKYHTSLRNLEALQNDMAALGFDVPWTDTHPQFKEALEYSRTRKFHQALDKLQQLVIQRLFELQKAHMSGVGYKMRTHIWKALRARSKAIQRALNSYNTLAAVLQPPAPTLEWKDIIDYGFVAEFDLLKHRHSHFDITSLPWASTANREVANKFHKIRRAKEEVLRLNIEIYRLRTFIEDEEVRWNSRAKALSLTDPLLSAELLVVYQDHSRVNMRLLERIHDIQKIKGYSGSYARGTRQSPTHIVDDPSDLKGIGHSKTCDNGMDGGMDVDSSGQMDNEGVDHRNENADNHNDSDHETDIDVDELNEMMGQWGEFLESSLT